jgi:hypothetical protein
MVLPPALLYYCSRPDYEKQFGPLSIDEARRTKELGEFPFPPTAHDIYFAGYVEWRMQEAAIRFDASPEECLATIQKIIEWHEIGTGYRHFDMCPTHPLTWETRLPAFFIVKMSGGGGNHLFAGASSPVARSVAENQTFGWIPT